MLNTLRKRLRSEKGFTLIELLVVMIFLAILTAIAIPSYLSFRDRANNSAAGAHSRAMLLHRRQRFIRAVCLINVPDPGVR
jgi:prepilin-type N-terminal cleavage/methylation domain-containing protein